MSTQHQRYISHYGVKGMRWGVRKKSNQSNLNNSLKNLSDEELRKAVDRMRLEQQYRDLLSGKSSSNQKTLGKRIAEQVISEQGKRVASGLVGAAMTAVSAAIASKVATRRSHNRHVQRLKNL